MRSRTPSRRRAFMSSIGSRLLSLWRRWSVTDWIVDRMPQWRSERRHKPMFAKASLDCEILETRFHPNDPFNVLTAPLLGSLSILGSDLFKLSGRYSAPSVRVVPTSSGDSGSTAFAASASAPKTSADLAGLDLGPHGGSGGGDPVFLSQIPGVTSPWQGADEVLGDPLGGGSSASSSGLGGTVPVNSGLSGLIVNPFATAPQAFAAPGGGGSAAPITASSPGGTSGGSNDLAPITQAFPATGSSSPTSTVTTASAPLSGDTPNPGSATPTQAALAAYAQLPMAFEKNVGQTDAQVQYLARGGGYTLFLTNSEAVLSLARPTSPESLLAPPVRDVIGMQFVGANPNVQAVGLNDLQSRSNYFTGTDSTQWIGNAPNYGQVSYKNLYNGVDALFYGTSQRQLEFDFIVAPGADPGQIQLSLTGSTSLQVDGQGNLQINTANGQVVQQAPTLYQIVNGVKTTVTGSYTLANSQVGFQPGAYDPTQPLYIDPVINYSTYLGGSGDDFGYAVAVDNNAEAIVVGSTASANFPTSNQGTISGTTDAFVAKFSAAGNALMYSSYLGGSGTEQANAVAVDPAGNAYIVGATGSSNFPVTSGALQTSRHGGSSTAAGFAAKLSITGDALLYSTYLGGSTNSNEGATGIAVDALGHAYVTGTTADTGFPVTAGAKQTTFGGGSSDAFAAELNTTGTAEAYGTFFGGTGTDVGAGIALDSLGDAFIAGTTTGGIATTSGALQSTYGGGTDDGFVTELNPAGSSLVYSSYMGGSGDDHIYGLAVDPATFVVAVTGSTSGSFPILNPFQSSYGGSQDAFVSEFKVTPTGVFNLFSSYLGGSGSDTGYAVALIPLIDTAVVVGATSSTNFPTTTGAFQSSSGGGQDGFLAYAKSSTLLYSSYLGGSSDDQVRGVALDLINNPYLTGWTRSTNFPSLSPFQGTNAGGSDAFLSKFGGTAQTGPPPVPVFTGISPDTGSSSADQITTSQNIKLNGNAAANSTVTISRADLGVLGTVTASTGGTFTYDYTATTLPEGTYAFTATDTLNSLTSLASPDYLVAVDLTAPTVVVTAPATTNTRAPQVRVTASDLVGLPTATVSLDVDLNNNGSFTDTGEQNYATATLTYGQAVITLPTLSTTGTYPIRARYTDLAGNQGTSATVNVVVASLATYTYSAQVLAAEPFKGDLRNQLGDNRITHPLDLDQSPGTSQSLDTQLVYNSSEAHVLPVVQFAVQTANNAALPSSVVATLTWDGTVQGSTTFSTTGFSPGDTLTGALQVSSAVATTARHAWSVQVTAGTHTTTMNGIAYVVTEDASPFGAGWTLSTADQLVSIASDANGPAGMLRIFGAGGWAFYQDAGSGNYTSPAFDNGTLIKNGNGTFTYTTPDGRKWNWDSSGNPTSIVSADGQETLSFTYASGKLTNLTSIDGALVTFTYTGSLVTGISAPGSRSWTLADSGTDLTSITDPDSGVRTFSYDTNHHATGDTFANLQDGWAYSSNGFLSSATVGNPSGGNASPEVSTLTPAVQVGLAALVAGTVQASVTDPLAHSTRLTLDALGRSVEQDAPNGAVTQWALDGSGRVTTQTDAVGRTTSFARDSAGYVTQETLPDSSTIQYAYQSSFHALTKMTDERGDVSTFTYDTAGHETTMVDALGETTTYAYSAAGLETAVTDPAGHTASYAYDTDRRLTLTTDAANETTSFGYDTAGNPLTVTDALLRVTTTNYDSMDRLTKTTDALGDISTITYNAAGLELTSVDALGHSTSMLYDATGRGLLMEALDAVGTQVQRDTVANYDAAGTVTATRNNDGYWSNAALDALERATKLTDPLGDARVSEFDLAGQMTAARDALGRWTKYAYDVRSRETTVTDALGNVGTTAYDAAANVTAVTDPLGHQTQYQYDKLDRVTATIDPLSLRATVTFDLAGNTSTVTDPMGRVTSFGYDAVNRRTIETDAVGTTVQRSIQTGYDKVGNVTTVTDALNHTTTTLYDKLNRVTETHDLINRVTTMLYDAVSEITETIDGLGTLTSYAYDALGNEVSVTNPLGNVTSMVSDVLGRTVGSFDPLRDTTQAGYDPLGRVTASVDGLGAVTLKQYDAVGSLTLEIDPDGNRTNWLFDPLDRQIKETDPLGNSSTMAYDAASRLTSATDKDSRRIDFAYDNDNRLTAETWRSNTGSVTNNVTYSYDNDRELLTGQDSSGTVTTGFDALGRQTVQTDVWGLTLTYVYDSGDRMTQRQDSLNGVLTNVYDTANRLTSVQFGGTSQTQMRVDLGYDFRNELSSLSRYADVAGLTSLGSAAYSYDSAGRVTSIFDKSSSLATLAYYNYAYDASDRVTSHTWLSGTQSYTYDLDSQLLSDSTNSFAYDANGNRTNTGYSTGTGNEMTNDGTWTYTYDAEGNTTKKSKGSGLETVYYGYDDRNRLTSVLDTSNGTTTVTLATYTYDVLNRRVQESKWKSMTGTVTTRHAFDGQNIWADLDGSNSLLARYFYGDHVNQILARTIPTGKTNAGLAYYFTDRLGSVRDLMDSTQTVRDHIDRNGYGAVTTETNVAYGDEFGYAGGLYDRDLKTVDFQNRVYDPATGRWNREDPMGLGPDANPFRYAGNDPANETDPSGLFPPWRRRRPPVVIIVPAPPSPSSPGSTGTHTTGYEPDNPPTPIPLFPPGMGGPVEVKELPRMRGWLGRRIEWFRRQGGVITVIPGGPGRGPAVGPGILIPLPPEDPRSPRR